MNVCTYQFELTCSSVALAQSMLASIQIALTEQILSSRTFWDASSMDHASCVRAEGESSNSSPIAIAGQHTSEASLKTLTEILSGMNLHRQYRQLADHLFPWSFSWKRIGTARTLRSLHMFGCTSTQVKFCGVDPMTPQNLCASCNRNWTALAALTLSQVVPSVCAGGAQGNPRSWIWQLKGKRRLHI